MPTLRHRSGNACASITVGRLCVFANFRERTREMGERKWIGDTLEIIVCALLSVMLSAAKPAAAQTQYGSPIKVAQVTQPCCIRIEAIAVLDVNGDGFEDVIGTPTGLPYPQNIPLPV